MKRHLQAVTEINYDLLDKVEAKALLYQKEFPQLNEIYVPGEGGGEPPIAFIVGEAPGAQEVLARRPFVGPAGRALRDLMAIAGLYTQNHDLAVRGKFIPVLANCWLTNAVKFRPPGNRNPTEREILYARDIVNSEWEAVGRPPVVIAVGAIANETLTGKRESILKISGKPRTVRSRQSNVELTLWPMVRPAYGLRNEAMRPILEKDWVRLGEWLRGNPQA